ncbi:M23 family metallopeptidase [Streptomyces sp. NPDC005271]|uniref:murein hydrolase activator EnvC family protein n=1 Tax=unclassified Streptomyces TaxID=2593676 RepID=UPI0033AD9FA9
MRWLLVWWALALCVSTVPALVAGPAPAVAAPAPGSGSGSGSGSASGPASAGARAWPVDGAPGAARPAVLRRWQPPPVPWAAGHRGVDLAARPGGRVRAAAAGRVSFAGAVAGRGVLVIEVSGSGEPALRTTYEPVRATVAKGDRVTAGQVVGVVQPGPFHCSDGCLHWGLRRADRYLDPLSLLPPSMLRGGPSRLLPVLGVPDAPTAAAVIAPAGWTELAPAAALATASAWARARLRHGHGPGRGPQAGQRAQGRAGQGHSRTERAGPGPGGLSRVRRAGPWRRPPR